MTRKRLSSRNLTKPKAKLPSQVVDERPLTGSLKKTFSLGGFLTFAMEYQISNEFPGEWYPPVARAKEFEEMQRDYNWNSLAKALRLTSKSEAGKADDTFGCELENIREIPDYSLDPLNSLFFADASKVPILKWDDDLVIKVKEKILNFGREVIGVHFRKPGAVVTPFSRAFTEVVGRILQDSIFERYSFLVLGDYVPPELAGHPRVLLTNAEGWSLDQQLVASSQTACFLGEASGFCTAAIFSNCPYLIFKDPDQHAGSVDRDIGPGGKILFSNEFQFLLRQIPTYEIAVAHIVSLITGARAYMGQGSPGIDMKPLHDN